MRVPVLLLFTSLLLASCSPLNRVSNRDMAIEYDGNKDLMMPRYVVYNNTDSTTRLYLKISSDNLLYQQKETGQPVARVRLNCNIFQSFETDRFSDTCSVLLEDNQQEEVVHSLIVYVDFNTPNVKEYVMELSLSDLNRHYTQKSYLTVNNRSKQSEVNYLVVRAADSIPIFTPWVTSTDEISILCRSSISRELYVRYFKRSYPLAAPAFRLIETDKFNYRSDGTYHINLERSNAFTFREQGIYHLQADTGILQGLTIFRFGDDYPRQTLAAELVEPLRYLTTTKEYNRIINSSDKKGAIDDFWLDIGGNKTKGRELIKIFYSRVEQANRYFTSYHEGWKTDRGLIYIIFGEPDVVYRGAQTEDWNYSSTFERGPVNFTFEKINNPFTGQDYVLNRSMSYQDIWFMAVDEWRQGRHMDIE